jgi:hypothetical protein
MLITELSGPAGYQEEVKNMYYSKYLHPEWFTDPPPDFIQILKPDDRKAIAAHQVDLKISAIDRQIHVMRGELKDLESYKEMLGSVKGMLK